MKFLSDVRLLLLGLWLGAAVFFIGVAQSAFAILPQRDMAGALVSRALAILNYSGVGIGIVLLLTSLLPQPAMRRIALWAERFLLLIMTAACAVAQFVIAWWMLLLRTQMGRPIDEVALEDPLRIQFNQLHEYSTWTLFAGMLAALAAFFIISNKKFGAAKTTTTDPFDFSKEFKK